jgi:hypothetical protein
MGCTIALWKPYDLDTFMVIYGEMAKSIGAWHKE